MRIAVVGSGGREHAILRKLAQSPGQHVLFALPGNGGTPPLASNISVDVSDVRGLYSALVGVQPDLVIVGPEQPLAAGLADLLQAGRIPCFGPSAAAARIESSKVFAKELMRALGVPTARFEVFSEFEQLAAYLISAGPGNWVVKADGLAAGKGAFVCDDNAQTLTAARALLVDGVLGVAGSRVVLEERLHGPEVSCMFWSDGTDFRALPAARDYKRALDGDAGPNTGGMGSVCPAPGWNDLLLSAVEQDIVRPVLRGLADQGTPFVGVLYAGLILTDAGAQVIEFNCRLGDPETQSVLAVWDGDFAEHARACAHGKLAALPPVAQVNTAAVSIVLAASGYPASHAKNISLRQIPDGPAAYTLHSGTSLQGAEPVSSGGRVLNAVGIGTGVSAASRHAYELAAKLAVPGLRYRTDIGQG
ncbi:phosphoribosylamine--glycine ligase [candidate division KSB1 bacterium]|nr:phosphoribosylamine--glycine ligase [candidate division KSB1 bacterium]